MKPQHLLLGLFVMAIWGTNFAIIKLGLDTLDPFLLTAFRFLLCAVPGVFFVKRPKGKMWAALLYGLIFGIGLWGMVNLGMDIGVPAGLAALLLQLSALFTIAWGVFFFGESISRRQCIGIVIALLGFGAIILATGGWSSLTGTLCVIIGAFSWSLCNIIIKKTHPPNLLAFIIWSSLFSAIPLFALTYWLKGPLPFLLLPHELTGATIFSVLFQAYITTLFGYWVWNFLLKKYSVAQVAPLSMLIPVFGFASAYWMFHETLSPFKILGVVVMLIGMGIFLVKVKQR
ncbi:MAG: EamA family transporter [Gammaproteobacteria bacterium]|jgi:O-acetylserine/cysteine efflux transporter|nr:EamA family transporter [Gammaproteobacteria bacterium]